jgi:hypothetical protein
MTSKVLPWHRWVIIVTLLAKSNAEARKQLKLSAHQHGIIIRSVKKQLGVVTLNHAALKLNLLKINYDELPVWIGESSVEIEPGVSVDLEGDQVC